MSPWRVCARCHTRVSEMAVKAWKQLVLEGRMLWICPLCQGHGKEIDQGPANLEERKHEKG